MSVDCWSRDGGGRSCGPRPAPRAVRAEGTPTAISPPQTLLVSYGFTRLACVYVAVHLRTLPVESSLKPSA